MTRPITLPIMPPADTPAALGKDALRVLDDPLLKCRGPRVVEEEAHESLDNREKGVADMDTRPAALR